MRSRCRRTARFWWAAISSNIGGQPRNSSPGSMPRPAWLIRSTRMRTMGWMQSRCRRTARFWRAAISPSYRRTDAQPHCPARCHDRLGRFVQPERERYCLCNRGAGGRQDFSGRRFLRVSADSRATALPGSIPPLAWPIRSTRTRTVTVGSIAVQADGKILAGGWFHEHRRTAAQSHRPARCHDRLG